MNKRWRSLTRRQCLWVRFHWSRQHAIPLALFKGLCKKLIGEHTLHLSLTFANNFLQVHSALLPVLRNCPHLKSIHLSSGCLPTFWDLLQVLPASMQKFHLCNVSIRHSFSYQEIRPSKSFPQLTNLNLSGCGWFTDSCLHSIIGTQSLTHVNLDGCYRLFGGPPTCFNLASRLKRLSRDLGLSCPHLLHLGLNSVFTLALRDDDISLNTPNLLNLIVDPFPQLMELDLSGNKSIVDYVARRIHSLDHMTIDSFLDSFLRSAPNLELLGPRLILRHWSTDCLKALLVSASIRTMCSNLSMSLVVDDVSQLPHLDAENVTISSVIA